MICPTNDRIDEFVSGVLDGERLAAAEQHIDQCMSCRELVSVLTQLRLDARDSPASSIDEFAWPVPGRYEISHLIGRGGMGSVFLAKDRKLKRNVALKMMRPQRYGASDDAKSKARFVQEAQNMAQVSHPNVVAVHDYGHHEGHAYIAMEYVVSQSLSAWLAESAPSLDRIVGVMQQAGEGLVAAHEAGLIHRDFKPDNVLVAKDGRVQITDFGLSSAGVSGDDDRIHRSEDVSVHLTQTGVMIGTPVYMSPEQHRTGAVDARSDQYSFCASLYEALCGRHAFDGQDSKIIAANKQANRLRPLPDRIPRHLRRLIEKGLRADPAERYASMQALLNDFSANSRRTNWRFAGASALGLLVAGFSYWQLGGGAGANRTKVVPDPVAVVRRDDPSLDRAPMIDSGVADIRKAEMPKAEVEVANQAGVPDAAIPSVAVGRVGGAGAAAAAPSKDLSPHPSSVSATTHIDLVGKGVESSEDHTQCTYCDISDSGSHLLLRFQQGTGHTIWSLYLAKDSKTGTQPLLGNAFRDASRVSVSLTSPSTSFEARGHYEVLASKSSTVTLKKMDIRPGGHIEGRVDAYLQHPQSQVQMHLIARFQAQISR